MDHTKGNWKVDESTPNTITVVSPWSQKVKPGNTSVFGDYRGAHICEMHWNTGVPTKETAMANARIISASPDMLDACIEAFKMYQEIQPAGGWQHVEDLLRFAITKATGETPVDLPEEY
jgi:hypothetical protein